METMKMNMENLDKVNGGYIFYSVGYPDSVPGKPWQNICDYNGEIDGCYETYDDAWWFAGNVGNSRKQITYEALLDIRDSPAGTWDNGSYPL